MKTIGYIGTQLRSALNQQHSFVSAADISAAVFEASLRVFGRYAGNPSTPRPGQPLPGRGYGLSNPVSVALNPFVRAQAYQQGQGLPAGVLPLAADGTLLFPVGTGLDNSFQRVVALEVPGARRVSEVNENALATRQTNSLTSATAAFASYAPVPGGLRLLPAPPAATLRYLAAPPLPVYAETPNANDPLQLDYDDVASVDVGWTDAAAINEILAEATRILGGEVKDQQAIGLANQTAQMGA